MNPLLKKEIRLVGPGCLIAVLLALPPICTRADDVIPVFLLFIGMTIMALSSIGRETSLNTFSSLLAQPVDKLKLWQTKLAVLASAFALVIFVWLFAVNFSFKNYGGNPLDIDLSVDVLTAAIFVAVATFTGGLWSTLLLRQISGAFWLTLLLPTALCGFIGAFVGAYNSSYTVITVLSLVMMLYAVTGFLAARWLFLRAQDVGWSGGNLVLPEWSWFTARSEIAARRRSWKPLAALLKKEFRLQFVALFGAVALLLFHVGVIIWRGTHRYPRNSDGETLTCIVWILWLILPVLIGSTAFAEERKLAVIESQSCLPISRRKQFLIKGLLVAILGILLGGIIPMLLEFTGLKLGSPNPALFSNESPGLPYIIIAISAWLTLASFYASSLARNFLQAIGYAMATVVIFSLLCDIFFIQENWFFSSLPQRSLLPLLVGVPVAILTLTFLSWRNFKSLQPDWRVFRNNILSLIGALVFVPAAVPAVYYRAWEVLEPAEPAHGPARLSLAHPPVLENNWGNVQVRLPDGRVWYEYLDWERNSLQKFLAQFVGENAVAQVPHPLATPRFLAGSNWVSTVAEYVDLNPSEMYPDKNLPKNLRLTGYLNTVGIRSDGTLWLSDPSEKGEWTGDRMTRYSDDTTWLQAIRRGQGLLLLKKDGTLWYWGTNRFDWSDLGQTWPDLRSYPFQPVGIGSNWKEIKLTPSRLAKKSDGTVWTFHHSKTNSFELNPLPVLDSIPLETFNSSGGGDHAYIRADGTIWASREFDYGNAETYSGFVQVGTETNWVSVAVGWHGITALRNDGTLWQWNVIRYTDRDKKAIWLENLKSPPERIGIHNDWVALVSNWQDTIALAADGSLWYWPDRLVGGSQTLIQLPKQPRYLGNVFNASN